LHSEVKTCEEDEDQQEIGYLDPESRAFKSTFSRFERGTTVSKLKQKPRIPYDPHAKHAASSGKKHAASLARSPKGVMSRSEKRETTMLSSIEAVLDRIDFNSAVGDNLAGLHNPDHKDDTKQTTDRLFGLMNNVMNNYEL
jgi:hypothetical protein